MFRLQKLSSIILAVFFFLFPMTLPALFPQPLPGRAKAVQRGKLFSSESSAKPGAP